MGIGLFDKISLEIGEATNKFISENIVESRKTINEIYETTNSIVSKGYVNGNQFDLVGLRDMLEKQIDEIENKFEDIK